MFTCPYCKADKDVDSGLCLNCHRFPNTDNESIKHLYVLMDLDIKGVMLLSLEYQLLKEHKLDKASRDARLAASLEIASRNNKRYKVICTNHQKYMYHDFNNINSSSPTVIERNLSYIDAFRMADTLNAQRRKNHATDDNLYLYMEDDYLIRMPSPTVPFELAYSAARNSSNMFPTYTYLILYLNEQDGYLSVVHHDENVCDFHKETTRWETALAAEYNTILAIKNGVPVNTPDGIREREMSAKESRQYEHAKYIYELSKQMS